MKIDGEAYAESVKERVREELERLLAEGGPAGGLRLFRPPRLDVILLGENPASQVCVWGKERDCDERGFAHNTIRLAANISQIDLLSTIRELNGNPNVDAALLQLP